MDPRPPGRLLTRRRQLRLGQLALAAVAAAMAAMASSGGECDFYARYLVPAAALQCAWAAVFDAHRPPPASHWILILDLVTSAATLAAASGALGVAEAILRTRYGGGVRCVTGEAPKAVLAWAALQGPAVYFVAVSLYANLLARLASC